LSKIWRFLLCQNELSTNCAVDKNIKISVKICVSADIQKVKYRCTDISVGLYISKYQSNVFERTTQSSVVVNLGNLLRQLDSRWRDNKAWIWGRAPCSPRRPMGYFL